MDRNQLFPLEKVKSMVDLRVRFDNNLTFRDHISEKINKAYSVLGIIKRNFIYMDERTVNAFKARLDKFWQHQTVKFDFTADLTGTGNRSKEVIK